MGTKKITTPKSYTICDKRRERQDGTAPVRLIIKYEGKQKVYGLDIFMTQTEYNLTKREHIGGNFSPEKLQELKAYQKKIKEQNAKAKAIIANMSAFTFEDFERQMFGDKKDTLFNAFESKIAELDKQGRAGYASSFSCAYNSIRLFLGGRRVRTGRSVKVEGGKDVPLHDVTASFLKKYETWFLKQTKKDNIRVSPTTVGIYLRNVRVLLHEAIKAKILPSDFKPFGKSDYRLPGAKKRKLALKIEEVAKIMYAEITRGTTVEKQKDYWVFLYLTGGMNVADMASLRYEDIDLEKISYIRRKTALKKMEEPEFIVVPLTVEVGRIIDKWGQKPSAPDRYIFPILTPDMNPQQERAAIVQATKMINRYIKKLASEVGISGNVSTYTARHSFATILKDSGVSVQAISEALGHSDTKVTQHYLKDFETKEKANQWKNLLPKKE